MKESWGIRVKSSNLGKRNDPATPVLSSDPLIDLSCGESLLSTA